MADLNNVFDFAASKWGGRAEWLEDLEAAGPDAVLAALVQSSTSSAGNLLLGRGGGMTKGFAEEWHAFKMRQKSVRDESRLQKQILIASLAVGASACSALAALASLVITYYSKTSGHCG
jgi:hypothetical protein